MIVHTGEMEPDTAWLSALLDAEAESYTPDSGRLSASVYERLASTRALRTRAFTVPVRLAGIPVGVAAAALCATVAMAVTATVAGGQPASGSSPTPSPSPDPAATATATALQRQSGAPPPAPGMGTGTSPNSPATSPTATATAMRTVTVAGEVDGDDNTAWSQEKVSVTLTQPVTSFTLTVKVAAGPKVASTGYWNTCSPNLVDMSVQTLPNGFLYTFQLKPGQVLPAGQQQFGVQFAHDASHDFAADTYHLTSSTGPASGGSPTTLQGAF